MNDTYEWRGNILTKPGFFYDSLRTVKGCDSIYELKLIVNPPDFYVCYDAICGGDIFYWEGRELTEEGIYYDTTKTYYGCDRVCELHLVVHPSYFFFSSIIICNNDSLLWHGEDLSEQGTYYDYLKTMSKCDSIYELELIVLKEPQTFNITGDSIVNEYLSAIYSVPADSTVIYDWNVSNGTLISTPTNNSVEIQWDSFGEGWISVLAESKYGCANDFSKLTVEIGSSGQNIFSDYPFLIYPNPITDILTINSPIIPVNYSITDLYGKEITIGYSEDMSFQINLSDLNSGIYFLNVENKFTRKIVKF